MKIDPEKIGQLSSPAKPPKTAKTPHSTAFADLLQRQIDTEPTRAPAGVNPVRPVVPPTLRPLPTEVYRSTEHLLDTLESYQKALVTPGSSLKGAGDLVRQLDEEIAALEPMVAQMPEGDGIKQIARDTLLTAAKEVARFNGGAYI